MSLQKLRLRRSSLVCRHTVSAILCVLAFGAALQSASAQPSKRERDDRFKTESVAAWDIYDGVMRRMQAKIERSVYRTRDNEKELTKRQRLEMKQCGDWALIKITETGPEQKGLPWGNVWLVNSKYSAYAEQRQENGGWLLVNLDQRLVNDKPAKGESVIAPALANVAYLLSVTRGLTLPGLKKRKGFAITETVPETDDGKWVRIRFSFRNDPQEKDPARRADPDFEGTAVLDTAACWVVKRAELKLSYLGNQSAEQTMDNEYRIGSDAVPIPVRATRRSVFFADPQRSKRLFEDTEESTFEYARQETVPEVEFSLTALELPEPVGVTFPQPTRWYLWLSLAGIASLGTAVALFKFATRHREVWPPSKDEAP